MNTGLARAGQEAVNAEGRGRWGKLLTRDGGQRGRLAPAKDTRSQGLTRQPGQVGAPGALQEAAHCSSQPSFCASGFHSGSPPCPSQFFPIQLTHASQSSHVGLGVGSKDRVPEALRAATGPRWLVQRLRSDFGNGSRSERTPVPSLSTEK